MVKVLSFSVKIFLMKRRETSRSPDSEVHKRLMTIEFSDITGKTNHLLYNFVGM